MGKREPADVSLSRKAGRKERAQGRPTLITDERVAKIAEGIARGMYPEGAAARAGLCKKTFYNWLRRGERALDALPDDLRAEPASWEGAVPGEELPFARFLHSVETAEAEAEFVDLSVVTAHSRRSWQAAAWKLERRHPQKYGRMNRVELSGPEGGEIPVTGFAVTVVESRALSKEDFLQGVGVEGLDRSSETGLE
jgi:transposase